MLDSPRISEIATEVAHAQFPAATLERVITTPATDSEGNEALRITLVLKPDAAEKLTGDQAIDLLVGLQQHLQGEGEDRLPIVEYATEKELSEDDDDAVSSGGNS